MGRHSQAGERWEWSAVRMPSRVYHHDQRNEHGGSQPVHSGAATTPLDAVRSESAGRTVR